MPWFVSMTLPFLLLLTMLHAGALPASGILSPTPYRAEEGAVVRSNGHGYNNRPLYINNTNAFVLAGDRPLLRFGRGQQIYGAFLVALARGENAKWLHLCDDVTAAYHAGRMVWTVRDTSFAKMAAVLECAPMDGALGYALRLEVVDGEPGDEIIWAHGSSLDTRDGGDFNMAPWRQTQWAEQGFVAAECGLAILEAVDDYTFTSRIAEANDRPMKPRQPRLIVGRCNARSAISLADAEAWRDPRRLLASAPGDLPVVCGVTTVDKDPVFWALEAFPDEGGATPSLSQTPEEAFVGGVILSAQLAGRVRTQTPSPHLDALLSVGAAEVDGAWYPPVFVHANMEWNRPLPGWQMIFGGIVCGWHDRVKQEAAYYIESQVTQSDKTEAKADPALRGCLQHAGSRFYGRGRILQDQSFYNMQTQFLDQLIYDWRATGDPELEALLRPALELHLEWARDCFDPDGDGLYESYLNTWPTDSVWYNGGGSAEESAYAYTGHRAARDMARRAGDSEAAVQHEAMMEHIKQGFQERLWIPRKGHAGKFLEQGGHRRVHEDPWLYSIAVPIDAGLVTPGQAAESLYYSEYALQNDRTGYGGRQVWTSNWVPGIWSVRPKCIFDYMNLSLAYFQAGFPEDGWDILLGGVTTAYENCANIQVGGASQIYRATLEGLFGYRPDYPNGIVRIAPQFPSDWEHANIETPDVTLGFAREGGLEKLSISLARPAAMDISMPVRARRVVEARVNGEPVAFNLLPGFGHTIVQLLVSKERSVDVAVGAEERIPQAEPVYLKGNVGQLISVRLDDDAVMRGFSDPQGVFEQPVLRDNAIIGRLAANPGHHTVVADVMVDALPQRRRIRIEVTDPEGKRFREAKQLRGVPDNASWKTVDLKPILNGDIRTIFQQAYLSPRPQTVSARIGTDGYSPWTFAFWGNQPPTIDLRHVTELMAAPKRLLTPQGAEFHWPNGANNVAFTSFWDNWPREVAVSVDSAAEAAWLLICGSTNPMQCNIANAIVRFQYADGMSEALELVPPENYWSLCPLGAEPTESGQLAQTRTDYNYATDGFCLPDPPPSTVQLGENCRAMLIGHRLRQGAALESVQLETLSQDVVVGLMGLSLMNPR